MFLEFSSDFVNAFLNGTVRFIADLIRNFLIGIAFNTKFQYLPVFVGQRCHKPLNINLSGCIAFQVDTVVRLIPFCAVVFFLVILLKRFE